MRRGVPRKRDETPPGLLLYDRAMAITGAHALIYTSEPDALRALFRDVFGWSNVDAGDGWLVFALPPAELAVHPVEGAPRHEVTPDV